MTMSEKLQLDSKVYTEDMHMESEIQRALEFLNSVLQQI